MKIDGFDLEILEASDLEKALAFQRRVIDGMNNKEWFTPLTRKEFLKPIMGRDNVYMLKDGKNEVALFVGTADFSDEIEEYGLTDNNVLLVDSIMVAEEYRGRGLQRKILDFLFGRAQVLGVRALVATVHPDNVYSVNNFVKLGYEIVGKKKIHGGPRLILLKAC